MLHTAFAERGVDLAVVDDRTIHGELASWPAPVPRCDAILLRSKSQWRNEALARWLEARGGRPVNGSRVLATCGDKIRTTLALHEAGVPLLGASVSLAPESGSAAAEAVGFPLVVKPVVGSWGRLIGKVNDEDALELALEHKDALGGAAHTVTYLQPFVETGGRDIRSFVVGDRCVAAIARESDGWKTNTALGGRAVGIEVDAELASVSTAAARAVGGGVVAVDLFESDGRYLVNEVNGTMEFRNSVDTTGVDIPGLVVDYVLSVASSDAVPPPSDVALASSDAVPVSANGTPARGAA